MKITIVKDDQHICGDFNLIGDELTSFVETFEDGGFDVYVGEINH